MGNEFKKGDTVYCGTQKGEVIKQDNKESSDSMFVRFENDIYFSFTNDGRYFHKTPIVLSHFPYELEMKRIEEVIELGAKSQQENSCEHNYILTAEQGHRIIKCINCNNIQTI